MRYAFLITLVFCCFSRLVSQTRGAMPDAARFSIQNCVNEFTIGKIESTKVGYQYWFADKNFINGRTLKMSVVAPHSSTHSSHSHPEDEFFFVLEGKAEFFLNGQTRGLPDLYEFLLSVELNSWNSKCRRLCSQIPGNQEIRKELAFFQTLEHDVNKQMIKNSFIPFATALCLFVLAGSSSYSQLAIKPVSDDSIDTNGFMDSSHHWYGIAEEDNVISALPDQQRYQKTEIAKIADNILLYQKANGGWPKNYDMLAILSHEQKQTVLASATALNTTFDNGTTHSQIEYLSKAFSILHDDRYKSACLRGIDFVLSAQYDNGGWPQFYPDTSGYRKYITFNDGAMIGVMSVLRNILQGKPFYSYVDNGRRERIRKAFTRGLDCIPQCQIVNNGRPTAWGQQHDNIDLRPRDARTYELPSVCGGESAEIVRFLMNLDAPSEGVIASVQNTIAWFESKKIYGIRVQVIDAPLAHFKYCTVNFERIVVKDSSATPIWARFYELDTERPLFCGRDGKVVYSLAEVERERRTGYGWYTYAPDEVLKKYPIWRKRWKVPDVLNH